MGGALGCHCHDEIESDTAQPAPAPAPATEISEGNLGDVLAKFAADRKGQEVTSKLS